MTMLFLIALAASAIAEPFFVDEASRAGLNDVFVCGEERQNRSSLPVRQIFTIKEGRGVTASAPYTR